MRLRGGGCGRRRHLLDLYVANVGPNVLYRNLGGGRFEDITEAAVRRGPREFGVAASFLDIDGDGGRTSSS